MNIFKELSKNLITLVNCIVVLVYTLTPYPANALVDIKVGSVIVDDEIEEILSNWLGKIFTVAGLKNYQPKAYLIHNPEINASATVGGQIFIHTGLITKAENAGQLLGVLAHEVGHIAGGHIAKFDQANQEAMVPAAMAVLLGGALGLAAGDPTIALAGLMGSGMAFERSLLKFTRTQESSADQAAMAYLDRLGWGCDGLLEFFKIIDEKTSTIANMIGPYALTHPLTSDRIKSVCDHVHGSSKAHKVPENVERDFQRLKGKILGFTEPPKTLMPRLNSAKGGLLHDPQSIEYARSIVYFRTGQYDSAIKTLSTLQNDPVYDAYATELVGQIYLDQGKLRQAAEQFAKAAAKRPKAKYMKILQAHALLEMKDGSCIEEAKRILIPLMQKNPEDIFGWRLLAIAYGKTNEPGMASLALAEEATLKGEFELAAQQCKRATSTLPKGSRGALQAEDLMRDIALKKRQYQG